MKHSLILLLLSSSTLLASIGEIKALRGDAQLIRDTTMQQVHVGTKLEKHDSIHTKAGTKLQIVFNDKTVISLGQNSDFRVDEYIFEDKNVQARFSVGKGFFKSITGKIGKIAPSHFKVKTANATIGVRGTTIIGEVTPKLDIIACTYGRIVVTTDLGSVVVNKGERTVVMRERSPERAQKVNAILLKKLDSKSDVSVQSDAPAQAATKITQHNTPNQKKQIKEKKEAEISQSITDQTTQDEVHSLEDIQQVVGTQKPVYEGKVTDGSTSYGAIKQDGVNDVHLGFDLGAGTMDGKLQFEDNIQQYNIDVAGRVKEGGSFDFNSQNGYDGGGKGALEGKKYEHANGSFNFEEEDLFNQNTNKIQGKFETDRK